MTMLPKKQWIGRVVAAGVVFAAAVATVPAAFAADELPVVDDIGMPGPAPLTDGLPPPRPSMARPYMARPYEQRPYEQRPYEQRPYEQHPYMPGAYGQGPYAAMPPARYDRSGLDARPVLPPYQVVTILRSNGYSPLGRVARRGWIYTIAALDPHGDDGRLIIDARTGRIMRFIPALAVDARMNDEIETIYGPPGPPVLVQDFRDGGRRGSLLDLRHAPRPPAAVPRVTQRGTPKVANRAPSSVPIPVTKPAGTPPSEQAAPAQAPAPAQPEVAASKPAAATVGATTAATPSSSAPSSVAPAASSLKLWPTQAMPDVQPLE